MGSIHIRNALVVNEGKTVEADVLVRDGRIHSIGSGLTASADHTIECRGKLHLLPGVIDDQVHFREPGLTHKGNLTTESRAAVAGGVTSYMEMPNTVPSAVTQELLAAKYRRAAEVSRANYAFYIGASNTNIEELLRTDSTRAPGIKIFMGSSTGDLLVDDPEALDAIFRRCPHLIATHCEHDPTVKIATALARQKYGDAATAAIHPEARSVDACYLSSSFAVALAQRYGSRLHILHISTAKETQLFRNDIPLSQKRITAEACIHHLWFSQEDYERLGNLIKWNPSIKSAADREAIWAALNDDHIDVIATDHAPHTLEEKSRAYFDAPSGGPLIQHTLLAGLDFVQQGRISLERLVLKMSHAVAECFGVVGRGYIREGYWADLVLVDLHGSTQVTEESLLHTVKWSPFMGHRFGAKITDTIVSGQLAYSNGVVDDNVRGMPLEFVGR
jgi:dihydroorotase